MAGSGSLYAPRYLGTGNDWVANEGVVSFDGLESNFAFMDVNYPVETEFTNYFYDINLVGLTVVYSDAMALNAGDLTDPATKASSWSVKAANVMDVPEPASVLLLGIGFAGLAAARRKQAP